MQVPHGTNRQSSTTLHDPPSGARGPPRTTRGTPNRHVYGKPDGRNRTHTTNHPSGTGGTQIYQTPPKAIRIPLHNRRAPQQQLSIGCVYFHHIAKQRATRYQGYPNNGNRHAPDNTSALKCTVDRARELAKQVARRAKVRPARRPVHIRYRNWEVECDNNNGLNYLDQKSGIIRRSIRDARRERHSKRLKNTKWDRDLIETASRMQNG